MQVAEVLSDLTSLYVCDHEAAVKLVSSHEDQGVGTDERPPLPKKQTDMINADGDAHLQRALDLVKLHGEMKEKHGKGAEMDQALAEARRKMETVFRQVSTSS